MSMQTVIPCRPVHSGTALIAALSAVAQAFVRWQQRRAHRRLQRALDALPDHMLVDIGLSRSETGSAAAEALGLAEATRVRVARALQSRP